MPSIDPTFHAVVKIGATTSVVTLSGLPDKKAAERHLKALGHEGTIEASAAEAQAKAAEANKAGGPGIDAAAPKDVSELLGDKPAV